MLGNVIEEYLVRLGVDLDREALSNLHKAQSDIDSFISKAARYVPAVAKVGAAITATLTSIIGTSAALVKSVANQEMAYDTLGRTMFVTTAQAKAMKTALDALGKSVNDVQVNPRLRAQYMRLLSDSSAMLPGGDYKAMMEETQDFLFEFTRLKQEISVGMQWISYYIVKDLAGPLGDAKKTLRDINNYIIQNMPRITRTVATGFGYIRNVAWAVMRAILSLGKRIGQFWDALPANGKKAIVALGVALAAFAAGPVGLALTAMGALLLLLDDYYAYQDGRRNVGGEYWAKLDEWLEKAGEAWNELLGYVHAFFVWLEHARSVKEFVRVLKDLGKAICKLAAYIGDMLLGGLRDLWSYFKGTGTVSDFAAAIGEVFNGVKSLLEGVTSLGNGIKKLLKIMRGNRYVMSFWNGIKRVFNAILSVIIRAISNVGRFANIIGKLLRGDIVGAKKIFSSMDMFSYRDGIKNITDGKGIGALSHKYEAADPGAIGSGHAYGSWQIIPGNMPTFLEEYLARSKPEYYDRLKNAGPITSQGFDDEWRAIAAEDPEGFEAAQKEYIADTHYGKQVEMILKQTGLNIEEMSRGVKEAVWSIAVQHGAGTDIVTRAIDRLGGAEQIDLSEASQKALIDAMYDIRMGYTRNDEGVSSQNLWDRWNAERRDAKAINEVEYEERANPKGGSFAPEEDDIPKPKPPPVKPRIPAFPAENPQISFPDYTDPLKALVDKWTGWKAATANAANMASSTYAGSKQQFVANVTINAYGTQATPEAIGNAAKRKIESILPERNIARTYDRGAGVQ